MIARVKMYTASACSYCRRAKNLLSRKGIPFEEVDVTSDAETREWLVRETGRRSVPQIFIDQRPIGGFDELCSLDERGELELFVGPAGPS